MAYEFALTRTVRDAAHLLDAVHGPGNRRQVHRRTAEPPRTPTRLRSTREPCVWRYDQGLVRGGGGHRGGRRRRPRREALEQSGHLVTKAARR